MKALEILLVSNRLLGMNLDVTLGEIVPIELHW